MLGVTQCRGKMGRGRYFGASSLGVTYLQVRPESSVSTRLSGLSFDQTVVPLSLKVGGSSPSLGAFDATKTLSPLTSVHWRSPGSLNPLPPLSTEATTSDTPER